MAGVFYIEGYGNSARFLTLRSELVYQCVIYLNGTSMNIEQNIPLSSNLNHALTSAEIQTLKQTLSESVFEKEGRLELTFKVRIIT